MRTTKNEKLLLSILVAIVFLGGNFYGYKWLAQQQKKLDLSYAELKADQAEAKVDLKDSGTWAKCRAWVNDHEPPLGNEGDAKAAVLAFVTKGARDNKLEVTDQNFNDVEQTVAGTTVNVSVKVKGSMEGLVKWLTSLEQPDQFYAVTSFSLNADQDQKSMVCTLKIARYFKGGT
ncbi:MAG: hypothetical protein LV480_11235 [Methylacidiphilales bacterium]|nr:hypothetical protein [Candidatus Methylacidiphilales bacterium]